MDNSGVSAFRFFCWGWVYGWVEVVRMTQTPEEIAQDLYMKLPLNLAMALPGPPIALIAAALKEAEERERERIIYELRKAAIRLGEEGSLAWLAMSQFANELEASPLPSPDASQE